MNTVTTTLPVLLACGASYAQPCNFGDPVSYPLQNQFGSGSSPTYVAAGDLDGDGDIDLVTDSNGPGNDPTHVLWNDGAGGFTLGPTLTSDWGFGEVDLGDMDGDGDLDVIRANYFSNGVYYFANNGDGTFASGIFYAGGGGCLAVKFLDFDNDGDLDFVTVDKFGSKIRPYRNINGLGFTSVGLFPCGSDPFGLDSADVDNDGDVDIVVTNEDSDTFTVCYNDGTGAFTATQSFTVGLRPTEIILQDINGDENPDAIVTDWDALVGFGNTVSVLLGDGSGGFGPRTTYITPIGPRSVRAADMNSDGFYDLVVACQQSDTFALLPGNGDGTFATAQTFDTGVGPETLTLADVDGDGDPDIAYAADSSSNVVTVANECGTPVEPPALDLAWQVGYDNLFNIDSGRHVAAAPNGDIIVAGTTTFNANEENFLVARFDSAGQLIWDYAYNGDGDHYDVAEFLGIDDEGNIFVAGESWGSNFGIQWAVVKLAPNGTEQWVRRYAGDNPQAQQNPLGFAIGPNGEFAMCGWARDASFLNVFFDIVCYDADGTERWSVSLPQDGTGTGSQGNALTFDAAGNVLATGSVPDDDEFGTEMLTAKVSPDGTVLWTDQRDLTTDTSRNLTSGRAITTDASGNVFVAAEVSVNGFSSNDAAVAVYQPDGTYVDAYFDTQAGSAFPTGFRWLSPDALLMTGTAGSGTVFAASFDPAGVFEWSVTLEGSAGGNTGPGHVALGSDDRLYFIDSDGGDVTIEQRSLTGEQLTRTTFDTGSTTDTPRAIASGPGGHLYVVGQFDPEIVNRRDLLLMDLVIADACEADITGDGALNFFDISAFVTLFSNQDPAADLDSNGSFNFFDVATYINTFNAGCP